MKKPIIGIAAEKVIEKPGVFQYPWYLTIESYVRAVTLVGGTPILLLPGSPADELINIVDGLLMQGGMDVTPSEYGEAKLPECGRTDLKEDSFHESLIRAAIDQKKPILGICRGIQIINVTLGGTLYQDLESKWHRHYENYEDPCHIINIKEGTKLHSIFGDTLLVNSLHHQGIKELAKGLIPSAYSEDGLIEAVENDLIMAIQCHPEALKEKDEKYLRLFEYFIEKCKN